MAYSVAADIDRVLGPYNTSSTTPVTTTDLTTIVAQIDQQVDAVLKGAGVASVPVVTGDDSVFFNYLNSVSVWGSAAEALKAIFPDGNVGDFWQAKYDAALGNLRNGTDIPSALLGGANDPTVDTYLVNNPTEEADLGDLEGAHLFSVNSLDDLPW
jgi:hypothetical protein